jgi:hypothetical protein
VENAKLVFHFADVSIDEHDGVVSNYFMVLSLRGMGAKLDIVHQ